MTQSSLSKINQLSSPFAAYPTAAHFIHLGPVHLKILWGWDVPRVYLSWFKLNHICMVFSIMPADGLEQMSHWPSSCCNTPCCLNSTPFSTFTYEALNLVGDVM